MKVLVTGATGFIGRHVIPVLLDNGYKVTALARNQEKAMLMPWWNKIPFIACDLYHQIDREIISELPDILVHLAWPGLPNYKKLFHFEENLPSDYRFLKTMISSGVRHVLVSGTCFEYGMQNGCLSEDTITIPANPYGLAKDTLRKFLEALQTEKPFTLQWVRLFYLYGKGQHSKSLTAQIESAIQNRESVFKMSGGEQLRDYMPVEEAARRIALLLKHPEINGIMNCCSSKPTTVRRFVEKQMQKYGVQMRLELGHYPYPDHEPFAFWGDGQKFDKLLKRKPI